MDKYNSNGNPSCCSDVFNFLGISPVAPITMGMMTTVSMSHIWRISSLRGNKHRCKSQQNVSWIEAPRSKETRIVFLCIVLVFINLSLIVISFY
ncbi:unnamed protein product [Acanthoscelides obtectus]|uniref:Uncharacterized protein n=1 Tax=Acanthoscelides obtectus TaxID=200917 RepID=A0A9P0PW10_ACAOB|nr:unnamed protein product [Acanthoscelides obtectus]CAK1624294.1 hypothetical protein AOBTE_LOCUS2476 [Acanthoscelides obtectus]